MKTFSLLLINLVLLTSAHAGNRVEYRLETVSGGSQFKWSSQVAGGATANPKMLESDAFIANEDFSSFQIKRLKSPPNNPDTYEIELNHNELGRKKFKLVANKDRGRSYCIVIGTEIYQCYSFPPGVKGLWEKSSSIHGPLSKRQAEELVNSIKK